jgi:hypothetical protein
VIKTWPQKETARGVVTISEPAMGHREVDLNALLACCRRELALRQRVYAKWIAKGWITETKAEKEIALMRDCCEYFVDAIFRSVTAAAIKCEQPGGCSTNGLPMSNSVK